MQNILMINKLVTGGAIIPDLPKRSAIEKIQPLDKATE